MNQLNPILLLADAKSFKNLTSAQHTIPDSEAEEVRQGTALAVRKT